MKLLKKQFLIKEYLMPKPKKIYILSGGTGGHVFPAKIVAEEFISHGVEVVWIGTSRGPEHGIAKNLRIKFIQLPLSGFRGKSSLTKIKAMLAFFYTGLFLIFKIWPFKQKNKEEVPLVAFGGYVSLAAFFYFRGPVYLQEQNTIPGSVSRLLVSTKKVKKVFCGFEQTINYFKKTTNEDIKFILSGNPIEKKISDISLRTFDNLADENDLSLKILVLGGSQGSKKLNELIPSISNDLGDILITHQTGKGNLSNTKELYEKENFLNFEILEFIEDMSKVYEWADVVISRSGALSVTEIMGSASVGIFVPLPWAIDNHQLYNAKQLTDRKAAFIIEESDTMNEDFICLFKNIRQQKLENKFNLIKNNSLNCFIKQSEKIIFQEITN